MNIRKGMQRLAIFVGVLGAIAGGYVSFLFMDNLLETRARHKAFDALANSDVVQQERKLRTKLPSSPQRETSAAEEGRHNAPQDPI